MIGLIEKELQGLKDVATCPNTPEKYKKLAAKKAIKVQAALDKIYAKHSILAAYERKICEQLDIDCE